MAFEMPLITRLHSVLECSSSGYGIYLISEVKVLLGEENTGCWDSNFLLYYWVTCSWNLETVKTTIKEIINKTSLVSERHGPICRKLFNKKRKPFNSLKQRLQGTDIPTVRKAPQSKPQPVRKANWRQQHEDFINAIRSAKQCTLAIKEGRPLPPPPPPTINPDYIQCPYCMRRFNENAANRHINFCKDQSSRRVFDPAQTAAKLASRAQGRVQMSPKKEPTVTSAVGALLQNRALEATSVVPPKPGLAVDPASGAKLRQGFTKSSKKD
ncbi:zinc finger C2HC domain-containing protein 1B [Pteropus vampyrus]|uniref:Zinc finger C2HC domain-containing protein 1B n=1 Tax=Pteropus vampyrus TaxID=132908 RepID=A0A6P6CAJ1_PTEVA|nr:zinc finger C2HC domain-containing protein 1B [Pteropus vampyrus]